MAAHRRKRGETAEQIFKLHLAGYRPAEISKKTGISKSGVTIHLQRLAPRILAETGKPAPTPEIKNTLGHTRDKVWTLYNDCGMSPIDIATLLALYHGTVRKHIKAKKHELGLIEDTAPRAKIKPHARAVPMGATPDPDPIAEARAAHGGWTEDKRAVVIRTGGKYAKIAKAAAKLKMPVAAVAARWLIEARS